MTPEFVEKKAYELAYALCRIAAVVRPGFTSHLEGLAANLLRAATDRDISAARKSLEAIHYFVRLAHDTGMVNPVQLELVIREINLLAGAFAELAASTIIVSPLPPSVDLEGIFGDEIPSASARGGSAFGEESQIPKGRMAEIRETESQKDGRVEREFAVVGSGLPRAVSAAIESSGRTSLGMNHLEDEDNASFQKLDVSNRHFERPIERKAESQQSPKQEIDNRQKLILEKITAIGNCRLRDIQEILPNTSERTIRYDLRTLVEQGHNDKVGQSGPPTYYQIRQSV